MYVESSPINCAVSLPVHVAYAFELAFISTQIRINNNNYSPCNGVNSNSIACTFQAEFNRHLRETLKTNDCMTKTAETLPYAHLLGDAGMLQRKTWHNTQDIQFETFDTKCN